MADCREISKNKQQKKARFESKAVPGEKSLASLFKEIKTLNPHKEEE
jgi:hypothetical protein